MTELSDQCCTLPPFKSDYVPTGRTFTIKVEGQKDLDVYTVGPEDSTTVLVVIYGTVHTSQSVPANVIDC
jgi:hypothetical protein